MGQEKGIARGPSRLPACLPQPLARSGPPLLVPASPGDSGCKAPQGTEAAFLEPRRFHRVVRPRGRRDVPPKLAHWPRSTGLAWSPAPAPVPSQHPSPLSHPREQNGVGVSGGRRRVSEDWMDAGRQERWSRLGRRKVLPAPRPAVQAPRPPPGVGPPPVGGAGLGPGSRAAGSGVGSGLARGPCCGPGPGGKAADSRAS